MEEIWKDVNGLEGTYQVSNWGRVKSLERKFYDNMGRRRYLKGYLLKPQSDKDGYSTICLNYRNLQKRKLCKIHRLVAEAFLDKIEGKDSIDHINGIRHDNMICNLRYCTTKENANFELASKHRSVSTSLSYKKNPLLRNIRALTFGKSGSKKVELFYNNNYIGTFESKTSAANATNVNYSTLVAYSSKNKLFHGYLIKEI